MSSMLADLPDLPDVDWSDPDVRRVLDMLGWKSVAGSTSRSARRMRS